MEVPSRYDKFDCSDYTDKQLGDHQYPSVFSLSGWGQTQGPTKLCQDGLIIPIIGKRLHLLLQHLQNQLILMKSVLHN